MKSKNSPHLTKIDFISRFGFLFILCAFHLFASTSSSSLILTRFSILFSNCFLFSSSRFFLSVRFAFAFVVLVFELVRPEAMQKFQLEKEFGCCAAVGVRSLRVASHVLPPSASVRRNLFQCFRFSCFFFFYFVCRHWNCFYCHTVASAVLCDNKCRTTTRDAQLFTHRSTLHSRRLPRFLVVIVFISLHLVVWTFVKRILLFSCRLFPSSFHFFAYFCCCCRRWRQRCCFRLFRDFFSVHSLKKFNRKLAQKKRPKNEYESWMCVHVSFKFRSVRVFLPRNHTKWRRKKNTINHFDAVFRASSSLHLLRRTIHQTAEIFFPCICFQRVASFAFAHNISSAAAICNFWEFFVIHRKRIRFESICLFLLLSFRFSIFVLVFLVFFSLCA